ncbi:MAG: hypothetical protein U0W94_01720 [Buchnera aphidicola (Schlechtendalia peitan)]
MLNNCSFLSNKFYSENKIQKELVFSKNTFFDLLILETNFNKNLLYEINKINVPFYNNLLLINNVKNNTNYDINNKKIENIIFNFFNKKVTCFNVISNRSIETVKKKLKISSKDIFINRNKALQLATAIHVNYLIYPSIYEKYKKLYLQLQMILVDSKEIIWEHDMLINDFRNLNNTSL